MGLFPLQIGWKNSQIYKKIISEHSLPLCCHVMWEKRKVWEKSWLGDLSTNLPIKRQWEGLLLLQWCFRQKKGKSSILRQKLLEDWRKWLKSQFSRSSSSSFQSGWSYLWTFFSSFVFFGFDSPCLPQYMCLALYFYYLAMTPEIHTGSILGATQWVHCTTVTIIISTRSNCINENSIFGTTYDNCQDGTIYESHPYQNTQVTMKHITFS